VDSWWCAAVKITYEIFGYRQCRCKRIRPCAVRILCTVWMLRKMYGLNEAVRQLSVGFRGICNVLLKEYHTAWGICVEIYRWIKECFNRYRVCRVQFLLAVSWKKEMLYRRCF